MRGEKDPARGGSPAHAGALHDHGRAGRPTPREVPKALAVIREVVLYHRPGGKGNARALKRLTSMNDVPLAVSRPCGP